MKKIILGIATPIVTLGTVATALACGPTGSNGKTPVLAGYSSVTIFADKLPKQKTPATAKTLTFTKNQMAFVTDGKNIKDKGFNEAIIRGFQDGRSVTGADIFTDHIYEPSSNKDIVNKYNEAITAGNKLIIVAGFEHLNILKDFAKNHQDVRFVFIDGHITTDIKKELPWNVQSIEFDIASPAFIMGALAAKEAQNIDSIDPVIGVYGGVEISTITSYLNAFKQGIAYFNEKINDGSSKKVELEDGGFVGNFGSSDESRAMAKHLVNIGSDIVLSVGGSEYIDTVQQVQRVKNQKAKIVGVDTIIGQDGIVGIGNKGFVFGSILKNLRHEANEVVAHAIDGTIKFGIVKVANIKNGGTGFSIDGNEIKIESIIKNEIGIIGIILAIVQIPTYALILNKKPNWKYYIIGIHCIAIIIVLNINNNGTF